MHLIRTFRKCGALGLFAALLIAVQASPAQSMQVIQLQAGMHLIHAELVSTPAAREHGLMGRTELAPNQGMLFAFERDDIHCFWMKNTPLPLSIAFMTSDGTIVNIADMQPQTLDGHCPVRPVRFALEMAQGWFRERGLKAGSKVTGVTPR